MDRLTLEMAMAMAGLSDCEAVAAEVAKRLSMTTTTLCHHVNGDGARKAPGQGVLDGKPSSKPPTRAREERKAA